MRAAKNILLGLLRALRNVMYERQQIILSAFMQAQIVIYMIIIPLLISLFLVVADNVESDSPEKATLIQMKYVVLAGYPFLGIFVGIFFRKHELNKRHGRDWRRYCGDIAKVGIISGGLASAKLMGIVAIMREVAADADTVIPTQILLMSMVPITIIVLVTFFAAKEVIARKP